MKKLFHKLISFILVLTLVLSLFSGLSFNSSAADLPSSGSCGTNVTYTFNSSTGLLTIGGSGAMNYYSSSNSPFYNQNGIKSIIINSGVTSIGIYAFRGCIGLTGITIPNSVTSIEKSAFSGCSRLTNITIPDSVTSIEYSAFSGCSSLTSVTIPNSVTSIGSDVFYGCSSLTSATIPNSVTSIGRDAFRGCSSLTSITIPNSVTSIGDDAFYGCSGLTGITIPNSVTSIGGSAFSFCSGLKSVTIPNSVTSIGDSAFSYCSSLTSVTIPDSVTSIGGEAFYRCSRLEKVNISSIEAWCKIRFSNSYSNPLYFAHNLYLNDKLVTDIVIPDSVTSIGDYAFSGCSGLKSVTIGNSVTSISNYAFENCSGLTSVTIPNSVTSIGDSAFSYCSSLTSVTIPNSVTSIGDDAFYGCSGLTSVTIPNSVTSIGDYVFRGCRGLTSVTISDSVTSIGRYAFSSCSELKSINIPNSVSSIGYSAFSDCSSLTSITIGNSVTSIGDQAFYGCGGLTSVIIPDSVTSIGDQAFYGCGGLKKVNISSIEAWCKIRFGDRYSNPLYYAHNLYLNDKLVTDIVIPNSVTSIGVGAFWGCSSLTSVTIPSSVTSIGDAAFSGCGGLTSIKVDKNNKIYDSRDNCNAIIKTSTNTLVAGCKNTVILNSVTSIGTGAFSGCGGLTGITIPNSVTSIGSYAFGSCYNLKDVFYTGTESQWNVIDIIAEGNWSIKKANIIFNYVEHEHIFGEGVVTEAPDCYNTGTKTYTCSVCGYKTYETLAALGHKFAASEPYCQNGCGAVNPEYVPSHTHNYTSAITTQPTCTEAGVKTFTCSCGDTYTEPVAALGHNYGEWTQTKAPTCTAAGEETRVCTRDASHKETRTIPALEHKFEADKQHCLNGCGTVNPGYVPPHVHTYNAVVTAPKATALGYTLHTCSSCGKSYRDAYTAPTGKQALKCKARTATVQTVYWNNVKTATGYQVQISTKDGKKWSTYATLKAGVTSYTFKKLAAGNNYKFRVRFYIKAPDGKNCFSPWSATLNSPTLPTGTTLTKLTAAKKAFNAQWKKNASVNGYQVQYSLKANFAGAKTITLKNPKSLKATASKLYAGKYYFVRIRTYKTITKANYFSAWSKTYKVKTK